MADTEKGDAAMSKGIRRYAFLLANQRCTLCGKRPEYCRCKCSWCTNPLWEQVKGAGWVRHVCTCKNKMVKGAKGYERAQE